MNCFIKKDSSIVVFMAYIVPLFMAVSFFFLAIAAVRTHNEIHGELNKKLKDIIDKEEVIITQPLWNVNTDRTDQILASIMMDTDVTGTAIFDENKHPFSSMGALENLSYDQVYRRFEKAPHQFGKDNMLVHTLQVAIYDSSKGKYTSHIHGSRALYFTTDSGKELAGTFFIVLSADKKNAWFHDWLKQYIIWMFFLLIAVLTGAVTAYWRTTLIPLNKLMGGIKAAGKRQFKEITGYRGNSEMDIAIRAFNTLLTTQAEHRRYLENEKGRLEEKVALRTRDLNESRKKYKGLVETTNDWIWEIDKKGVFTYSNPKSEEISGHTPETILGTSFFDLMTDGEADRLKTILNRSHQTRLPIERKNRHKNGSTTISETSMATIFDAVGNTIGYRGIDRNITERKKFERLKGIQRDLGTALGLSENFSQALDICLDAVLEVSHFDSGGFYLVDPENGGIRLIAHKNLTQDFLRDTRFYDAASPQAMAIKKGVPVYDSYDSVLDKMGLTEEEKKGRIQDGIKSIAIIPIRHEKSVMAAMNIGSTQSYEITQFDQYALETIAAQMAGLLAKIQVDQSLKESRINLRHLFDTLNDFLFVLDESGHILDYNILVEQRLGYTPRELSRMHVLDLHPNEKREEAAEIVKQMVQGHTQTCNISLQTKMGSQIPVATQITRGTWNNKNAIFGISRDITDMIKSQAQIQKNLKEKEVLLREIHHRVKNNMQVVSSLLSIQADDIRDKKMLEIFTETEARVQSMAFVHELLYQSENLSEINLQIYVESLADYLLHAYAPASQTPFVDIQAANIFLKSEQAVPCGMIVTELLTNALKYARPKTQELEISIRAACDLDGCIRMEISDNGQDLGHPFDLEHINSLGLRLVTELISDQLEGKYQVTQKKGVCWTINWPGTTSEKTNEGIHGKT